MDKSINSSRNSPNIEYFIYETSSDLGAKNEKTYIGSRVCLLYTSPSPRDRQKSRMPSSA